MDRFLSRISCALLLATSVPVWAQTHAPSDLSVPAIPPQSTEAKHRFEQMPPEQRQKIRENAEKWKSLPKEERQEMRLQAKKLSERVEKSVDELVKKNGWALSPERRKQLVERYRSERSRIEKILQEQRRPMVEAMNEKLKAEFSPTPSSTPEPTPPAQPTPAPSP